MALAPAACSSEDDASKDAADTAAVQEPSTGVTGNGEDSPSSPDESANTSKDGASSEVFANSIEGYIDYYLAQPAILSDYETTVLTKAREQGGVSVTQYEQAWSRYKQCMTDLGYKNVILDHLPNGLYQRVMSDTIPDQAKYDKAMRDDDDCYDDIAIIAQVYNAQIGNVHFYTDIDEGFIDCLRRNSLVPISYTADQYSEERASQQLSFNLNDPEVVGCAVANNYFYGYEGEPHTNWFQ